MKLLFVVACAAAEHHAPLLQGLTRPALLQRRESDLLASKEELPERTYTGRASVFDVFRAMEDEGAKRMGERKLKLQPFIRTPRCGPPRSDTAHRSDYPRLWGRPHPLPRK